MVITIINAINYRQFIIIFTIIIIILILLLSQ
jgi:hypothetical protein